jgi:hypothetical protein
MTTKLTSKTRYLFGTYENHTLPELMDAINVALEDLPEDQRASATFGVVEEHHTYDENPAVYFAMTFQRPETAEETAKREASEAETKLYREQWERRQYEELKAKFEEKA